MVGIRSVDPRLLEMARSFRATGWQVGHRVEIPAALPAILGGMRVGVTLAVIGAIVAEWAGGEHGLGVLINIARGSLFDIPLMFATLVTLALIGVALYTRHGPRRAPPGRRAMSASPEIDGGPSARAPVTPRHPRPRARGVRHARRRGLRHGIGLAGPLGPATPEPSAPVLVAVAVGRPSPRRPRPRRLIPLTVGLGYIPSVQFAQFYLADQAGYYRDAGLTVDLQNKRDPDLITLLGQGAIDIGNGDGTSVIPAVSQGIPIVYTATIYGQFPSVVLAKADSGITTAADLKGKKIGIPGKYGSSWIMLQALLGSASLTTDDVTIVEYPDYGQAAALQQGAVDAATGFANNEPIQLRKAGHRARRRSPWTRSCRCRGRAS